MAFITIETLDSEETYNGVSVETYNHKKKTWNSGDFTKDWYRLNRHIYQKTDIWKEGVMLSSSVDHFIMDSEDYESRWLKTENDVAVFAENYDYNDPGLQFFIPKGTNPTWDEHCNRCR